MLKPRILTAVLIVLLLPTLAGAADGKAVARGAGASRIVSGDLGNLGSANLKSTGAVRESARAALQGILMKDFDAAGFEEMVATKVTTDELGAVHVRFEQKLNGLPVAGAAMVLHAHADGKIFAVNGEFVSGKDLPVMPSLDAETAFALALGKAHFGLRRLDQPELSYVLGSGGQGHLAWKMTVDYQSARGPQRDAVFADAETGRLVARHAQFKYALSAKTYDCGQKTKNCVKASNLRAETPPDVIPVSTGDLDVDTAHNFAAATYNYYSNNHGRDSIDDAGMTLISRVHFDRNYNNAFWDGTQMTYGDGDGTTFIGLSRDADVVAHELTHGVTEFESGLIYANESGALNEAWSDIFGSMVDRQEGAMGADIWLLGEDIYTPAIAGDALRNMADPAAEGDPDYYPDRNYPDPCTASQNNDNCGVHSNSGIANLAFVLLVDGGAHPRGKTTNNVPGIGHVDAAAIFYAANADCLTPGANFAEARYCTADMFGDVTGTDHSAAVHAAWDAVGVPNDPPDPPNPPIALTDGVPMTGQAAATGNIQSYTLGLAVDHAATCTTSANNGDADLYLRFGAEAEANPNSTVNACGSYSSTSNESCSTGGAPSATTLFATVHAYAAYTNLTITCTDDGVCTLAGVGESCSSGADCCSGSCSGGKPGTRECLP